MQLNSMINRGSLFTNKLRELSMMLTDFKEQTYIVAKDYELHRHFERARDLYLKL
jgi:hypothetical protein